jgi:lipopolysaccharide biosynthesis glycosyltransferase
LRTAIVTICIGDEFTVLSSKTHPTIKRYAERIGAEFIVIDKCTTTPHWEKFQINDLLNKYDRIIYLDTDLIVRDDCPNLFDIVPYNQLGAFNESKFAPREYSLLETAKAYGIDPSKMNWNGKYYNTGVMVISKCHKKLFSRPTMEVSNFYEQGYLNLTISKEESFRTKEDTPLMYDLPYQLNRMTCLDISGETRHASYIIHYAGYHYFTQPGEIELIIQDDLKKWTEDSPGYNYKRKIVLVVSGGMGDQVCAEPTLRFLQRVYKDTADIIITTHYPKLFEHLGYPVYNHNSFVPEEHKPFYQMQTFPDPETVTYSVISNLMSHTVDYCSIACLQRVLPLPDKIIQLKVSDQDNKELDGILNGFDLSRALLIHPGRHWSSKSFPKEWWQEIVDTLSKEIPICLIGTDDHSNRGAYQLDLPDNSINLIDRTSIGTLMASISRAPILLSNDSSPIHIAGAFDNWIVVIPTCKHPDHILPFRMGKDGVVSSYHKAKALYKRLTLDDCDQRPTSWLEGGATAETKKQGWEVYLPDISEVCEKIRECYKFKLD